MEQDLTEHCRWVCSRLRSAFAKVAREEFKAHHMEMNYPKNRLSEAWSDISRMMPLVLKSFDIDVERSPNKEEQTCNSAIPSSLPDNHKFNAREDEQAKRHFGDVVAQRLHREYRDCGAIALGSGTTCLHMRLQMYAYAKKAKQKYSQTFWANNIATATEWAKGENHPAEELHIPDGALDPIFSPASSHSDITSPPAENCMVTRSRESEICRAHLRRSAPELVDRQVRLPLLGGVPADAADHLVDGHVTHEDVVQVRAIDQQERALIPRCALDGDR